MYVYIYFFIPINYTYIFEYYIYTILILKLYTICTILMYVFTTAERSDVTLALTDSVALWVMHCSLNAARLTSFSESVYSVF